MGEAWLRPPQEWHHSRAAAWWAAPSLALCVAGVLRLTETPPREPGPSPILSERPRGQGGGPEEGQRIKRRLHLG